MLFRSHNRKQHRSVCVFIVCHFLSSLPWRQKWRVSWFNDFIGRFSQENKPRPQKMANILDRLTPALAMWLKIRHTTCYGFAVKLAVYAYSMLYNKSTANQSEWSLGLVHIWDGCNAMNGRIVCHTPAIHCHCNDALALSLSLTQTLLNYGRRCIVDLAL